MYTHIFFRVFTGAKNIQLATSKANGSMIPY